MWEYFHINECFVFFFSWKGGEQRRRQKCGMRDRRAHRFLFPSLADPSAFCLSYITRATNQLNNASDHTVCRRCVTKTKPDQQKRRILRLPHVYWFADRAGASRFRGCPSLQLSDRLKILKARIRRTPRPLLFLGWVCVCVCVCV